MWFDEPALSVTGNVFPIARAMPTDQLVNVVVMIAGGATVCPISQCLDGTRECDEAQAEVERRREENRASQTCVRAFMDQLGVSIEEDLAISNGFVLTTSAGAALQLATHPHVISITPNAVSEGPG
jgi:hypothetical protein